MDWPEIMIWGGASFFAWSFITQAIREPEKGDRDIGTSMGGGRDLTPEALQRKKALPVHHRDTEIYFATYLADGKSIVDKGHLTALDDPEVRRVASKYGDPDELLREDWVPAIKGVNVE